MNPAQLVSEIKSRGVVLKIEGDHHILYKPKEALPDHLKDTLRKHKPGIIRLIGVDRTSKPAEEPSPAAEITLSIGYFEKHIQAVIGELNYRGIQMMDVPAINRDKVYHGVDPEELEHRPAQGPIRLSVGSTEDWQDDAAQDPVSRQPRLRPA